MLEDNVKFIEKEWKTLIAAPFTFLLLVVLTAISVGYYYSNEIARLEAEHAKQVQNYRERLGIAPRDDTKYSKLTHDELRVEVERECSAFATLVAQTNDSFDKSTSDFFSDTMELMRKYTSLDVRYRSANTEESLKEIEDSEEYKEFKRLERALSDRYDSESRRARGLLEGKYIDEFKPRMLMLRKELLARLPYDYKSEVFDPFGRTMSEYEIVNAYWENMITINWGVVVTDLRQMSSALQQAVEAEASAK